MKVSVITVSYNSSETIEDTITSVNNQSYADIEHIFIDAASKDGTQDIIKNKSLRCPYIISEQDKGIYDGMNKGISKSNGEILFILNSDDTFASNSVIESVVQTFLENPGTGIVYGHINFVKKSSPLKIERIWRVQPYKQGCMNKGWHPPHPGLVVKREVYDKIGNYNNTFKIAADFEFMIRAFEICNIKSILIDKFICTQKLGGASNSLKGILNGSNEIKKSFEINGLKPTNFYLIRRYVSKILQRII